MLNFVVVGVGKFVYSINAFINAVTFYFPISIKNSVYNFFKKIFCNIVL